MSITGVLSMIFSSATCCVHHMNMDQSRQRRESSEELRRKTTQKHVKCKDYKTIFKLLHVPVTVIANVIKYNAKYLTI